MRRWVIWIGTVAVLLVAVLATPAFARSLQVESADVEVRVLGDGSLKVEEQLTFVFDGSYVAAYRDIPMRPGEAILQIGVLEEGRGYQMGGCTTYGCSSPAGSPTFVSRATIPSR